jgi:hypothetical protein
MSATLDTLNTVLANIQKNKTQITQQIAASIAAMGSPDADVQAAIDLLIATYGANVQVIGQTIGAQLQIEQLQKTSTEIDALIAGMQVVLADEALVEAAEALVIANGVSIDDPLSDAAGNSQPSAANDAAPVETPAAPAEASDTGTASGTGTPSDGTAAS